MSGGCPFSSRRGFMAAAGGLAGALGAGFAPRPARAGSAMPVVERRPDVEPFWGARQGGILTPTQSHTYFAAFDLVTEQKSDVVDLLRRWTGAAARMTAGDTATADPVDPVKPVVDSGDALGLKPARLTMTFGFGPGLFVKDGKDRFGLASRRPEALVDMPKFSGDQLVEERSGGDLSVQACADDPQVAFHAVRQLATLAYGIAQMRWAQSGFSGSFPGEETPRNLMGFKDGTQNPLTHTFGQPGGEGVVFVGAEGPGWMQGGSYLVARRIRISLEHWDRTDVAFQEQVIGRTKRTGAPLGGTDEFEVADFAAVDTDGNPVIPEDAHVRLAAAANNDGAQILRRAYSYNDGLSFTAERWPPWRQGMMFDAGLFFIAYQRDPRTGFIRIYEPMSKLDALNQFTTHTASALFAVPRGAEAGEFIGQELFGTV